MPWFSHGWLLQVFQVSTQSHLICDAFSHHTNYSFLHPSPYHSLLFYFLRVLVAIFCSISMSCLLVYHFLLLLEYVSKDFAYSLLYPQYLEQCLPTAGGQEIVTKRMDPKVICSATSLIYSVTIIIESKSIIPTHKIRRKFHEIVKSMSFFP